MEDIIKTIEIPNFLKINIIEVNDNYCSYYVVDYNKEYFYADKMEFLKTYIKANILYELSIDIPFTINKSNVEHLEKAIYRLHKELTNNEISRAEKEQMYYSISSSFGVQKWVEINSYYDNMCHKTYNYFLSKAQAERFASKMQDYLIQLWKDEREQNKRGE